MYAAAQHGLAFSCSYCKQGTTELRLNGASILKVNRNEAAENATKPTLRSVDLPESGQSARGRKGGLAAVAQ